MCPGEPKLKQAWSEPGSKLAPAVGEQGPTASGPHRPRNACLGEKEKLQGTACPSHPPWGQAPCGETAGLWEPLSPGPLWPADPSRALRPLCCCSAFTAPPSPDSLQGLDVGIGPEHGRRSPRGAGLLGCPGGSWSRWASDRAGNTGLGTENCDERCRVRVSKDLASDRGPGLITQSFCVAEFH